MFTLAILAMLHVDAMNAFANTDNGFEWADAIGGDSINPPTFVIMTGDMTGESNATQWDEYSKLYVKGTTSKSIVYDVFPGLGNHDAYNHRGYGTYFNQYTSAAYNHGLDYKIPPCYDLHNCSNYDHDYSATVLDYSFVLGGVKFVQCNLACAEVVNEDLVYPQDGLDFLTSIEGADGKYPTIIFQHYGLDNESIGDNWWTPDAANKFKNAIQGKKVKALFTGHSHTYQTTRRNIGNNNWLWEFQGSSGGQMPQSEAAGFFVCRIGYDDNDLFMDVQWMEWTNDDHKPAFGSAQRMKMRDSILRNFSYKMRA